MLRDCFMHAGLVAANELSKTVDIIIVHIDPSDSQFFWAWIAEAPYVSITDCYSLICLIRHNTGCIMHLHILVCTFNILQCASRTRNKVVK
jgi:hypothetical protein